MEISVVGVVARMPHASVLLGQKLRVDAERGAWRGTYRHRCGGRGGRATQTDRATHKGRSYDVDPLPRTPHVAAEMCPERRGTNL